MLLLHVPTLDLQDAHLVRLTEFNHHHWLNDPFHYSVTENGFAAKSDVILSVPEVIHDVDRVEYYRGYTEALLQAIHTDGVPIKSYFAWSECSRYFLVSVDTQ